MTSTTSKDVFVYGDTSIYVENTNVIPQYMTEGSVGLDIRVNSSEPIVLKPNERRMLPSGCRFHFAPSYYGLLIVRSSIGIKGLVLQNQVGVIDNDYKNEIKIPIHNVTEKEIEIAPYERLAQLILCKKNDSSFNLFQLTYDKDIFLKNTNGINNIKRLDGFGSTNDDENKNNKIQKI